ncbi:type I polyketide synthase [Shewanella sp. HN-41]|uniref:type I polyketide synthase n=1 Tax=Shewanella sp. HN-41 TaxID=327275 RepID=UPI00021258E8|nr:type I polyketide synthase [Shewanella sp. HN-41]EGM70576.1 omega-3 polyunsaturated fatty acid synthase subunit, PfaA [Shewanella sp. HN-41]
MSHTPSVPNSATESKKDKRLNKRLKDMPVAIVGMASIFANSRYLNKFWDLISEKIDAITDIPDTHWRAEDYYDADKSKADKSYCKRGGFLPEVDFNPMEFGLPPNILELTDTSQLLSLIVAKEVLADANLPTDYDRDRIGITLGVGGGQKISQSLNSRLQYPVLKKVFKSSGLSDEDSEMLIKKFQDQYIHWEENSFPGSLGNVIAGRIANRFDFGGMNCVVDAACAGSLAAMRMALTELTEGRSDMMITGGVCTDNSPSMYMSFSKTPAFTTNETIQPFDIDSKGMMIGEGIGMVALKRLEDAERDGDRIYAVIKGVGASSDGKFKSIYAPRPEGQAKALERAYDDAGFAPHSIGLVEAHGTGTAAGDVAEFNGLKSVFAQGNDTNQHIALGSVKSQVGHTKSTAGTAGVIKAALALHHKVLPATINVSKPNPKLNIESSPFYLNTETRPWLQRTDGTPRRAGISSFGFGGTNFHLVLEEYKPEHSRDEQYRQRSVPQTLLFAAANKAALLSELKAALSQSVSANANKSSAASLNAIAQQYPLRPLADTDARLGFVAKDIAQLQAQLNQSIAHLETNASEAWLLPSGISYRSYALVAKNESKKVAALFAGQGSQYLNMGRELACHFPEMRQQVMASDRVFAHHGQTPLSNILYPIPAFDADAVKAQEAALTNTMFAQSAIGAVSMAQYSLLTQAGFAPDMVAGHSFGELSALCAAGVISNEDYVELAFARGHAMAQVPSDTASKAVDLGTMYAIILKQKNDIDALNSCLAQFDGVKIANYNAPTQLVIAGGTEQTQLAAKAISELGFKAIALPVSGAFHTPLVGHAQKPFAKAIDKAKFSAPSIALYANGTGQLHPSDGKAIKAEFKQHMLQSVRFSEQLQAMYDAGARVFVEFGPKNILQKLVENTLGEHLNELCLISMNPNPKGDSDSQLRLAAVQLAVAGVALTEVDPYQAVTSQEIAEREAPSAMNIKLTATNHISAATKAKMAKSLATGSVSSQVQYVDRIVETVVEKEVEKIVEKEVIVEKVVEKIIEVEANQVATVEIKQKLLSVTQGLSHHQQQATAPLSPSTASVSGDALTAFFSAQSQAAQLHQQFLAIPQQYGDTFTTLMTEQAKMASLGIAIPESLQRSMEMFHQHQAQTLQSHAEFMQLQSSNSQAALAMLNNAPIHLTPAVASQPRATASAPAPVAPAPVAPAPVAATPVAASTVAHNAAPVATQAVATRSAVSTPVAPVAPVVQTAPVAYAPAVTVQVAPAAPAAPALVMPAVVMPEVTPVATATSGLSAEKVQQTMMAVVADKTGYPTEMLELGMDMEADLGIDSIKRVEILGTVQDELPGLPELSPEDLAECRTLGEIVAYMNSKLPAAGSVVVSTTAQAAPAANGLSAALVQQTMMAVVADKTGYPTEMLELSMDMEADLGIDSIKRVEILGTVQDELPGLPELNPEDLAECRTLGEIVSYMQSKLGQNAVSQNVAPVSAVVQPEPAIDLPPHDLPPHSEVVLKKLPAAAELTQQSAQGESQQALTRVFAKDACIIIADDGHNAGVLAEKLYAQGLTVAVVRSPESLVASASPLNSHIASFTLAAIDDASISAVINEIKSLGTVAGFIHLQPQHKTSADAKGLVLSSAAKASVEQAFLFAKHLQPLLTTAATANTDSSFISVSRIDGGFGYLNHSQIARSELNQAALAGLTKTLSHEWPSVHCRALDIAPALDAKQLANAVIAELFATDNVLEVGVSQGAAQALERVTLVAGKADTRHSAANLTSTDKILVTGGAKGVTFECALSLAKRSKAHFILAGRSSRQAIPAWAQGKNNSELKAAAIAHIQSLGEKPTPKQVDALVWPVQSSLEIAAALEAFTVVGASAEYLSLDVNNPEAIASTIMPISELSPITGIIHGAGVLADKHIQDKTLDELARVYGTKVTGISNLLAALDLDKLKLIALFSSAAGFYGNTGQSDYAMSNDILNKAALQLAQQLPNAKVMSFDWGPWDGGMVNPALKKMFIDRGVYVIPLKAGAELFASQLLSNTGAQLLVGTDMQGTAPSDEQATQGSNLKKPKADLTTDSSGPHALASTLTAIAFTQTVKLQRTLDPKAMIFIEDHCINGNPVLPTVCAIQWMREAAFDLLKQPVKVQSYKLLKGIIFDAVTLENGALENSAPITLELELAPMAITDKAAKDTDECLSRQFSALISFEGRPQYQAILVVDDAIDDVASDYLATNSKAIAFDAQSLAGLSAITTASSLYSDGTLFHGPRLQGIESVVKFDDASLVAKVSLPHVALADCGSFVPNLASKGSQAFAEDLLLQAMLVWARLKYGAASLPSSIGEFISHTPFAFGDKGYLVLEVVKHSGRALEANIALYHQDGRLSCGMSNAKVTISKNLNGAFLANKVANKAIESVEAKVE